MLDTVFTPPGTPLHPLVDELVPHGTEHASNLASRSLFACRRHVTPLPPPSKPPDAEDWANYKSIILDLYVGMNLSLSVVRQRMLDNYDFVASEKMFKDRFKKWDTHKYYSQEDVDVFLANVGKDSLTDRIHGQPVRWDRIKRRFPGAGIRKQAFPRTSHGRKRANSAASAKPNHKQKPIQNAVRVENPRKRSTSLDSLAISSTIDVQPATACVPAVVRGPSNALSVYNGCRAFSMLQNYLDERLFSAELVDQFFGPVEAFHSDEFNASQALWSPHPSSLNQRYARGIALLRDNRVKLASSLLAQASEALESLVVTHHPGFPDYFLDAFVEPTHQVPQAMSGYIRDLAVKTAIRALGSDHPITVLCRFVQWSANDDGQTEQLLFFCARFCELFSNRLGKQHKLSAHVNLKHFAKLLQLRRLDQAYAQLINNVEPAFADIIIGTVPRTMRAACLCYLRRRAHFLSSAGDQSGADAALRQCVNYAMDWLAERDISVAGNPLMEECFRLIDEIGEWTFSNGHTGKGVDLHSFAIGLCAAVRGEREGKAIRMISAQLARYEAAGYHDRVRIMQVRFPNVFADESDGLSEPTEHILPCPTCANGPDTQLWCEEHRLHDNITTQDKVFVRLTRECLADLLKWFGMFGA